MRKAPAGRNEFVADVASDDQFSSEFASESQPPSLSIRTPRSGPKAYVYVAIIVGALATTASVAVVGLPEISPDATLVVESEPAGKDVLVDGTVRGRTPLTLTLAPGSYLVKIEGTTARPVALTSAERASFYHVIERQTPAPASSTFAGLSVVTHPAGGRVSIDGQDRGAAPLTLRELSPGEHRLVVRNSGAVFQQTVTLEPGLTSTVVIGAAPTLAAGWMVVQSPIRLQIHEGATLLGSTDAERLMLPAGDHQLTFSNEQTGFVTSRTARITSGEATTVTIQVPQAPVSVNAAPWADVWVNNTRVGETPIGNYLLPIGNHQIELRHPQLGTKRVTIPVGLNRSNRVAVNMRER